MRMLTLEDFQLLDSPLFDVRVGEESIYALELVEAAPSAGAQSRHRTPFALLFHGPADAFLAQGTYGLVNETLGREEIFVVPVGRREEDGRFVYQACFN